MTVGTLLLIVDFTGKRLELRGFSWGWRAGKKSFCFPMECVLVAFMEWAPDSARMLDTWVQWLQQEPPLGRREVGPSWLFLFTCPLSQLHTMFSEAFQTYRSAILGMRLCVWRGCSNSTFSFPFYLQQKMTRLCQEDVCSRSP